MPSEHRLHPASMLFAFGRSLKVFAVPGLLVLLTAGGSSGGPIGRFGRLPANWEVWMMLFLIPSVLRALARYLSFRVRYEGAELAIRSGIIFRNERHVPYARIQNLDGVQNIFHRALGVIEVRVETGAGREPEATISVLPVAAFEEMRRRVFEGRIASTAGPLATSAEAAPLPAASGAASTASTLLYLPLRELFLFGFLENRGLVVIGAAYGVLWELGLLEGISNRIFDDSSYGRGVIRVMLGSIARGERLPLGFIAVALTSIVALLAVVRLASMIWAAVRLYDFRLTRAGGDLRTEFGLFTRVATTIPVQRVQTMTIREGPLQRRMKRVSVRVETAGGGATEKNGAGTREREWLAPIIRRTELPNLAREVLPAFDVAAVTWHPPHPRAFRRAVKPAIVGAVGVSLFLTAPFGPWALALLPLILAWAVVASRKYVGHLGWAVTDDVVAFRSGWLWRSTTVARTAKIQAVARFESPFDRRAAMAQLRVDTAGAGEHSHRVHIPYLSRETAHDLHHRLAAQAATTAFRW